MRFPRLAAVLFLAFVIGAIFLWFESNDNSFASPNADLAADLQNHLDPAAAEFMDGSDERLTAATNEERPAKSRVAVQDSAVQPSADENSHSLAIHVAYYSPIGESAAQVQGYWMPLSESRDATLDAWEQQGVDSEALIRAQGNSFTTDDHGDAQISVPNSTIAVFVRSGEFYAEDILDRTDESDLVELNLEAVATLEVFVHNKSGEALADFPLALMVASRGWTSVFLNARSDETGHAYFKRLRTNWVVDSRLKDLELRAAAPFLDAQKTAVDLNNLPEGTLDYTVGPFGSLTLHLQDQDGSAHTEETRCMVQISAGKDDIWDQIEGLNTQAKLWPAELLAKNGQAHFPYIGLGLELAAAAWMDSSDRPYDISLQSPQFAGEHIKTDIWMEHLKPVFRFRFLDLTGEPLRNQTIDCGTALEGSSFGFNRISFLETDADGYAEYIVTLLLDHKVPGVMALEFTLEREGKELKQQFSVPSKLQPGVQDFGDIFMLEQPILLAGKVLDAQGNAQVDATLYITFEDGPQAHQRIDGGPKYSQLDGSFALRGECESSKIRLHVQLENGLQKEVVVAPKTQDLIVQFETSFRIPGKLLLDEDLSPTLLSVIAAPISSVPSDQDEAESGYWTWPKDRPLHEGEFEISLLEEGPITVYVTDEASGVVLAKFDHVLPVGEGEDGDPRLQTIDLRGKLSWFRVKFTDRNDLQVDDVRLKIFDVPMPDQSNQAELYLWQASGIMILPVQSFRFEALSLGQRKLQGVVKAPGETTFQMESGLPARVRIFPSEVLPVNGRAILHLTAVSEFGTSFVLWDTPADENGEFHFHFPEPGRYQATLDIRQLLANGVMVSEEFPKLEHAPIFEVLDTGEEQVFELQLGK